MRESSFGARVAALLALAVCACTAAPPPPTHFGRWGPISTVHEPERSVLLAALAALPPDEARTIVLAHYAGDRDRRLDLAPLAGETAVAVDTADKLGPIDTGMPEYRSRVFEYDFPGRKTILELSVPALHGGSATLTASHWDALSWRCELPGRAETFALERVDGRWMVRSRAPQPGSVRLRTECSAGRSGPVAP